MLKCKTEPVTQKLKTLTAWLLILTAILTLCFILYKIIGWLLLTFAAGAIGFLGFALLPDQPEPTTKAGVIHQTIPGQGVVVLGSKEANKKKQEVQQAFYSQLKNLS